MSYLMDYSADRPLPPEAEHEPMTLAQRCGVYVAFFAVLYAACALWIHFDPPVLPLTFPAPPAQGHTSEATSILPASGHTPPPR